MPQVYGSIGRVRVTGSANPSEAGYIRYMRGQMDGILENVRKIVASIEGATPEAIVAALQPIYDLSQQYVPVDTGALKASGFLEVYKEPRSGHVRAQIGYARYGNPFYALYVHEMVHIGHAKGKSAKFLERAIKERIHVFKARLVDEIFQRSALGQIKGRAK